MNTCNSDHYDTITALIKIMYVSQYNSQYQSLFIYSTYIQNFAKRTLKALMYSAGTEVTERFTLTLFNIYYYSIKFVNSYYFPKYQQHNKLNA